MVNHLKEIERLRFEYDFNEKFHVVLATAFEKNAAVKRFPFYNQIGEMICTLGKKAFLPHREVADNWTDSQVYNVINRIVIPSSELVLGYLGIPDVDTGMMLQNAIRFQKPVILFYEDGIDHHKEVRINPTISPIVFRTDNEALEKLEKALRDFPFKKR